MEKFNTKEILKQWNRQKKKRQKSITAGIVTIILALLIILIFYGSLIAMGAFALKWVLG